MKPSILLLIVAALALAGLVAGQSPTVSNVQRTGDQVTSAPTLGYAVDFSEPVLGAGLGDFAPATVLAGASIQGVQNSFRTGLDFSTTSRRVIASNLTGPSGFTSALTIEFWARDTAGGNRAMFSYAVPGQANEIIIEHPAALRIWLNGTVVMANVANISDGAWHHLALTWQSSTGLTILHVDGVATGITVAPATTNISLGGTAVLADEQDAVGGSFNPNQAFLGRLDEVRVWAGARSTGQIAADRFRALEAAESDLVLHWSLDEFENLGVGAPGVNDVRDTTGNNHGDANAVQVSSQPTSAKWFVDVGMSSAVDSGLVGLDVLGGNLVDLTGNGLGAPFSGSGGGVSICRVIPATCEQHRNHNRGSQHSSLHSVSMESSGTPSWP